jgi:hypothetical protein
MTTPISPVAQLNTNRHFAQSNDHFRKACELAGIDPTERQAAKYRRGEGKAAKFKAKVLSLRVHN